MTSVRRAAVAAAGAAGLLMGVAVSPASAATDYGYFEVVNTNSGKCLEIPGGQDYNGAVAQQWDCNSGLNQRWYLDDLNKSAGTTLVNAESGKCLEVADWRTDPGAPIRVWDCHGGANQKWSFGQNDKVANEGVLWNNASWLVIDVPYSDLNNGTDVVQWNHKNTDDNNWNQVWALYRW